LFAAKVKKILFWQAEKSLKNQLQQKTFKKNWHKKYRSVEQKYYYGARPAFLSKSPERKSVLSYSQH
jgi:hypothetical protein